MFRQACCAKVEIAEGLLGVSEGSHFSVGMRTAGRFNEVDADRDKPTCAVFKDRGAEWAAGSVLDIDCCQFNDKTHAGLVRGDRFLLVLQTTDRP